MDKLAKLAPFVKFTSSRYTMYDLAPYTYYWNDDLREPVMIRKGAHSDKDPFKNGQKWRMKILFSMEKKHNGRFNINFEESEKVEGYKYTSSVVTEITERVDELLLGHDVKLRYNSSLSVHSDFEKGVKNLIENHNTKTISIVTISGTKYTREADPVPSKKRKAEVCEEEPSSKRTTKNKCLLWKLYKWCTVVYPKRYTKPVESVMAHDEQDDETFRLEILRDPKTWQHYFEDPEDYFRALQHFNVIVDGNFVWRDIEDYRPDDTFKESRAALRRALEYLGTPLGKGDYNYYNSIANDKKVKEHCPKAENVGPAKDFTEDPSIFVNYFHNEDDLYRALEAMREEDMKHKKIFQQYNERLAADDKCQKIMSILHSNIKERRHHFQHIQREKNTLNIVI